ncbi:MAG: tetratricopeptide repeat protein [Caulobacteraceae bacterium]
MKRPLLWSLLAILTCGGKAAAEPPAPAPPGLTFASGIVDDGASGDDLIWFSLSDLRFEAPTEAVKDPDGLFALAKRSAERHVDLVVGYDLDSGFIDPATGKATFDIRQITVGDKTLAGVASSSDVRRTAASPAEAALARALGLAPTGEVADALPTLATAVADRGLPTQWRILALKTRGEIEETQGDADFPAGSDRDRRLIASLADNRAWAALAPDDADAASAVAYNLMELGAYPEALGAYRAIRARWPDQDYSVAVRIGAVYRTLGQYAAALASLDDLVARKGPQVGMKFHYHRGVTLLKLGRNPDAVKEFDAGLKDQPDYGWALAYRACALAGDGRLDEALSNQRSAIAMVAKSSEGRRLGLGQTYDLKRASEVAALLLASMSGGRPKVAGLCENYWDWGGKARDRSPLLPAS